jgi:hypothetical protein
MSDKNGIAQVDKPVQLTWRNRRVKTRENDGGVFFLVEMEIDEESWGFLKTIPRNANGEMVIWMTEIGMVEEKPKKPKVKTPYGDMWQELLHRNLGFEYIPSVADALEDARQSPDEDAHTLMRKVFGVESLSLSVGPEQIYAKFPPEEYRQIKAVVDQAIKKSGGRQG